VIAGLPMYDLPELRPAHDALWQGLAAALADAGVADAPPALAWATDETALWAAPDLLLSQTCGYPLRHALAGRIAYVATPCYAAPGCQGATYASAIVVPIGSAARDLADLTGARRAVNAPDSWSGRFALDRAVSDAAFPENVWTGSHAASLAAVARGDADVAAIDAVTFALLGRHRPESVAGVRLLAFSQAAPALPFVTRPGGPVAALRRALRRVVADPALADTRAALLLDDVVVLDADAYAVMDETPRAPVEA